MQTASEQIKTFGPVDERSLEQLRRCLADVGAAGVLCADHHPGYSQPIGGARLPQSHLALRGRVRHRLRQQGGANTGEARRRADRGGRWMRSSSGSASAWGARTRSRSPTTLCSMRFGKLAISRRSVSCTTSPRSNSARWAPAITMWTCSRTRTIASGSACISARADSVTRRRVASCRSLRAGRSSPRRRAMQWTRRRHCSPSTPTWGRGTSRRCDSPASTRTRAGTGSSSGSADPRHRGRLRGAQPSQLRVARGALWRACVGYPEGLHPGLSGPAGFVGASMGGDAVILEGVESSDAVRSDVLDRARRRPSDVPHAGCRQARNVYECTERDCRFHVTPRQFDEERRRREVAVASASSARPGSPCWADQETAQACQRRTCRLRGSAAAPAQAGDRASALAWWTRRPRSIRISTRCSPRTRGTIRVLHRLRPVAVAMAGADTFDPFKD